MSPEAEAVRAEAKLNGAAEGAGLFAPLQLTASQRRRRQQSLGISAVLQIGLWLGLAWLVSAPPHREFSPPFSPFTITWMMTPRQLAPAALPVSAAKSRPLIARRAPTRLASVPSAVRPPPLARPRLVQHLAVPDPPAPITAPSVVAKTLPVPYVPLPPQPARVATVRVGSFGIVHSALLPPPAALPHTGDFASPPAGSPAVLEAKTEVGIFGLSPAHPPRPAVASSPAVPVPPQFGFQPVAPAAPPALRRPVPNPVYAPPVILAKPTPRYTAAARARHLEGDVVMQVVLTAAGEVRIVRVLSGLGDGLNEAAQVSARAIRFQPARRDGQPVDATVLVRVSFRLAE